MSLPYILFGSLEDSVIKFYFDKVFGNFIVFSKRLLVLLALEEFMPVRKFLLIGGTDDVANALLCPA